MWNKRKVILGVQGVCTRTMRGEQSEESEEGEKKEASVSKGGGEERTMRKSTRVYR